MLTRVGILGVGMHLPDEVRHNDWWPQEVVARWSLPHASHAPSVGELSESARAIVAIMQQRKGDPFQGVKRRRVIAAGARALDLEVAAVEQAIAHADVDPEQIDLVLTHTAPATHGMTNTACELHERLGLPRACSSLQVEGAQHSFLLQLELAHAMISSGRSSTALLVQSSALSRVLDPASPLSGVFGDGATAVVVGQVSATRGVLGSAHRTDGRHPHALIASPSGGAWHDEGRSYLHIPNPLVMRDVLLGTVDNTCEAIAAALGEAQLPPTSVDVLVMHQGMAWLRELVQQYAGLSHTASVETIEHTGHLFGAFVPSTLFEAHARGLLQDDTVVVVAGGGAGSTYGATVIRWGA